MAEALTSCPAFGVGWGFLLGYTLGQDTDCPKVGVFVISLSQAGAIRNITLRENTIDYCHIGNPLFFIVEPSDTTNCELPTDNEYVLYRISTAEWRDEGQK